MEINRTGITFFDSAHKIIEVLIKRGPNFPNESLRGESYPEFVNCPQDATVFAVKAVMQGDEVIFNKMLRDGAEATRGLYIGPDGAIVEGASQDQ